MDSDGVSKFYAELGLDLEDPVVLLISFYMDAQNMGEYSQEEFEKGMKAIG